MYSVQAGKTRSSANRYDGTRGDTMDTSIDRPDEAPLPKVAGSSNYFARHWRGELSLGISYWVNGALLSNLAPLAFFALAKGNEADTSSSLRVTASLQLCAVAMTLIAMLWSSVGIVRSANRHVSRGGHAGWANLAKVMVGLGVFMFISSVAIGNVGRQWLELSRIAFGHDPMPPIEAKLSPDRRSLLLWGTLGTGSAEAVRRALDESPNLRLMHLTSNGGRLFEARAIAAEVRRRRMDTYVDGQCASACTLIFLAGRDRGATPNAKIGFHRPSFAGNDDSTAGTEAMLAYYREAGISEAFIARVRGTPSSSLWYPTRAELSENHVVTRVSLGGETSTGFTGSGIASAEDFKKALLTQAVWRGMDKRFPGSVDRAAGLAWKAVQRGQSDDQALTEARAVVSELMPQALAQAPDELLERFVTMSRNEMQFALALSPDACVRLLEGRLNIVATLPRSVVDDEMAVTQALFETPARAPAPPLTPAERGRAMSSVSAALSREQIKAISEGAAGHVDPALRCSSLIAYYDAVSALPTARRRLALRVMFQS